jgi:UDPglucose 6-dehydrogenase
VGAAFKPGTDDIRDSPALAVAADLIAAGAAVAVHDPQALHAVRVEQPLIDCIEDPADVLDGAAVLLHLTSWGRLPRRGPGRPVRDPRSPM